MTAEDLYREMKDVLVFFNLRFHDMEKVSIQLLDDVIIFTYDGKSISIRVVP